MTGELESLAAEYALGLLTGEDLRAAKDRLGTDAGFAKEVARWRGRMAPLHEEIDPVVPPSSAWERIAHSIGGAPAANDNVVSLKRSLHAWRWATAGTTAIAASLALMLILQPWQAPAPAPTTAASSARPPMVAMLGDQQAMKVVASWDPDARQLVLAVAADMPGDPQHSHELWVIPADGKPRSIGVMPAGKQMHMKLADALATLLQKGATIAISVEPAGGSKTGAPTGPVVASGALRSA